MDNSQKIPEYLLDLSREFRKNPTLPEEFIWKCLRNRKFHGLKFRRQHVIGRYVADFCCVEAKLVLEIDGKTHEEADRIVYDRIRDEELSLRGFNVLRIKYSELCESPHTVFQKVSALAPPRLMGEGARG